MTDTDNTADTAETSPTPAIPAVPTVEELIATFGEPPMPKASLDEVDPKILAQVTRRLRSANHDHLSERRHQKKELGDAVRHLIAQLVATDAPDTVVAEATAAIREVAARFDGYERTDHYGLGESAIAGSAESPIFDQSPLIGIANPLSPPMSLRQEGDRIIGEVHFNQAYEGPPGCVHGGYIAATFDEVLGATQSLSGAPGMTGTLSVRYESPTPLHTDLRFESWIERVEGRKIFVVGECHATGTVSARATGIFISLQPGTFIRLLAAQAARSAEGADES